MINENNIHLSNQNNKKSNKEIIIPDGFRELLQDMTVEVLRTQPTDVLTFCIDWLTARKAKSLPDQENIEKKKFGFGINKAASSESKPELSFKAVGKSTADMIKECKLFTNIEKSLIQNLFNSNEIKSFEIGEEISLNGKNISDKIYIIQEGCFELFSEFSMGKLKVGELCNNEYFGDVLEELTCVAKSAGKLIAIKRSNVNPIVLEKINKKREEYKEFVDGLDLFANLTSYEKRLIIDSMTLQSYKVGQEIIKENDVAKAMFLIYEGFVSIVQDGKEISTVNEGGYFGELGLLDKQPRVASVQCITNTNVLCISADIFKAFIEPKCTEYMDKVIKTYFGDNHKDDDDDDSSSILDSPPPQKTGLPRKSVSAGKFNPELDDEDDEDDDERMDEEMMLQDYSKTEEQRNRLRACCKDILLFRCLDDGQLEVVIDSMFQKVVTPGDVIITRGEDGDNFYVIDNGVYDIIVPIDGVDTVVSKYDNKGSFGELALMYNTPRSATVKAKTSGLLWAMTRDMFRKIVLKKAFQKRLMYDKLLGEVPFLKELSSFERNNIADALRTRVYEAGTPIINQGDEGLEMYFIEEGYAEVIISYDEGPPSLIGELEAGRYFGELALINRKPRAATICAKTKCKIAVLDRDSFERLLGPCINVMKRNMIDYNAMASRHRPSYFKTGP